MAVTTIAGTAVPVVTGGAAAIPGTETGMTMVRTTGTITEGFRKSV